MEERWTTLLRFSTVHEAEVARGLLEAAGIEATLLDTAITGMAWHLSPALGGVRLQVRPEDREAALAVLAGGEEAEERRRRRAHLEVLDGGALHADETEAEARGGGSWQEEDLLTDHDLEARRLARRALGAALLGVIVPIALHLYSGWLLFALARRRGRLDRRSRAWAAMALAIDALVLVPATLFVAQRVL